MDLSTLNIPHITMAQTQQRHLQQAKRTIYASKGGETRMNKTAIALSGIALASIAAVVIYWPSSTPSAGNPVTGQLIQPAQAYNMVAQAQAKVAQLPQSDQQRLSQIFQGNIDDALKEAKQAADLTILSAQQVAELDQQVFSSIAVSIMPEANQALANYRQHGSLSRANLTILSYTHTGRQIYLALDPDRTPVFKLAVSR